MALAPPVAAPRHGTTAGHARRTATEPGARVGRQTSEAGAKGAERWAPVDPMEIELHGVRSEFREALRTFTRIAMWPVVVVGLATAGAACGSSQPPRSAAPRITAATTPAITSAATAGGPATTLPAPTAPYPTAATSSLAPTTATPATVAPVCPTAHPSVTADLGGQGAAGHSIITYQFANTASTPCTLTGYPGVSVLNAQGLIVQQPATRYPGPAPPHRSQSPPSPWPAAATPCSSYRASTPNQTPTARPPTTAPHCGSIPPGTRNLCNYPLPGPSATSPSDPYTARNPKRGPTASLGSACQEPIN